MNENSTDAFLNRNDSAVCFLKGRRRHFHTDYFSKKASEEFDSINLYKPSCGHELLRVWTCLLKIKSLKRESSLEDKRMKTWATRSRCEMSVASRLHHAAKSSHNMTCRDNSSPPSLQITLLNGKF